jgi:hypothetical protein
MPRIKTIMMAFLFVRSQRKDMSDKEGNRAFMTRGIVSPTMTQNATMPPNALLRSVSPRQMCPWVRTTAIVRAI